MTWNLQDDRFSPELFMIMSGYFLFQLLMGLIMV